MNRLHFISIIFITIASLAFTNIYAQVTIGMTEAPAQGALLQLKNKEDNSNWANSNQGLGLPRVELTSITNLFPMFPVGYDKSAQDRIHTGLIVYNTNEDLKDGDGKGIYYWDGEKWYPLNPVIKKISISPNVINLSEINPTMTAKIKTTPIDAAYHESNSEGNDCVIISKVINEGTDDILNFQGKGENYGRKILTYELTGTNKQATVEINYIHLRAKELLKLGNGANISSETIVQAQGGSGKWFVKDYSKEGFLSFELGEAEKSGNNMGYIVVAHVDDPNYTKTIKIEQNNEYITLPDFDYLVVKYSYKKKISGNVDLDIATVISGTGIVNKPSYGNSGVDDNPAGYKLTSKPEEPRESKGIPFMYWGGDNQTSGYENVYVNMTNLKDRILTSTSPQVFYVDTYATWYYPELAKIFNKTIELTFTMYKGGRMEQIGYDFVNVGGKEKPVFEIIKNNVPVTTFRGDNDYKRNYTKLLRLEYDRIYNTGVLVPFE